MRNRTLAAAAALLAVATAAQGQQRVIAGRITDQRTARPVTAGLVSIQGHLAEDRIRPDGVFVLRAPRSPLTLVVRSPGYRTREIDLPADQDTAFVALEPDVLALEGLTVTGRATSLDTRNRPTSNASLGSDRLGRVPAASLTQAVQGKVAGADIQQNSGVPGGDLQVRLRGVTTILGSHSPLYVLDGAIISNVTIGPSVPGLMGGQPAFPGRIADLNTADIASIEILKGAAAAAMYGSKGSNGVVIITTKRGGPARGGSR